MRRKLNKYKCPKCNHVNPMMEMINTVNCLNCKEAMVEKVPNGYVIIETEPFEVIEISND